MALTGHARKQRARRSPPFPIIPVLSPTIPLRQRAAKILHRRVISLRSREADGGAPAEERQGHPFTRKTGIRVPKKEFIQVEIFILRKIQGTGGR